MQIRAPIVLQAVLKSLQDVVLPALDPENKLAAEQSQLIVGLLTLLATRQPLQFRYDRHELTHLIALAREIGASDEEVRAAVATSEDALKRAFCDPQELVDAIGRLRAAVGASISAVAAGSDKEASARVQQAVLAASAELHTRERSWLAMQGWEVDPAGLPEVEQLLEPLPRAAT